jgi:hypothetical protein
MDLAAFRLGEIEEHRPGVFRHVDGLRARLARFGKPRPLPQVDPQPDPYAWRSLDELLGPIPQGDDE